MTRAQMAAERKDGRYQVDVHCAANRPELGTRLSVGIVVASDSAASPSFHILFSLPFHIVDLPESATP
jgi:hypothetical protein